MDYLSGLPHPIHSQRRQANENAMQIRRVVRVVVELVLGLRSDLQTDWGFLVISKQLDQ